MARMKSDSKKRRVSSRETAGKRIKHSGYVDTEQVVEASEDEPEWTEDCQQTQRPSIKLKALEKRQVSPPVPASFPARRIDLADELDEDEVQPVQVNNNIVATCHVPTGFTGPIVINVDLNSAFQQMMQGRDCSRLPPVTAMKSINGEQICKKTDSTDDERKDTAMVEHSSVEMSKIKPGFLSLPSELRNQIYRESFVTEKISFPRPQDCQLSASLLGTCRQVYEEGRQILYSENKFCFARDNRHCGNYWDRDFKHIGWTDIRRFLTDVSPSNVALLRHVHLIVEDGSKHSQHHAIEFRRAVDDDNLMAVLKLLAEQTILETIALDFRTSRTISLGDKRFLSNLKSIKCDNLVFIQERDASVVVPSRYTYYYYNRRSIFPYDSDVVKLDGQAKSYLLKMERKKKLYDE